MAPNIVVGRIPIGYNDFGSEALTDVGQTKFNELILKRLPDDVAWCGDELIGPVSLKGEIDIDEIIGSARDEMFESYQDEKYWEQL